MELGHQTPGLKTWCGLMTGNQTAQGVTIYCPTWVTLAKFPNRAEFPRLSTGLMIKLGGLSELITEVPQPRAWPRGGEGR